MADAQTDARRLPDGIIWARVERYRVRFTDQFNVAATVKFADRNDFAAAQLEVSSNAGQPSALFRYRRPSGKVLDNELIDGVVYQTRLGPLLTRTVEFREGGDVVAWVHPGEALAFVEALERCWNSVFPENTP